MSIKSLIKKIIPPKALLFYHYLVAGLAAIFYGFPSKELIVIGVTGTKGKTTVSNLIAEILQKSGFKTGLATTVNFRIGSREWKNVSKQTMLGRFGLQKLLRQMVNECCKYAVIETSSEGIMQYRHRFIDYDAAVFTNLTPEHIERHGSFENYRRAKKGLFEKVSRKKNGIGIYNLDDENAEYFIKPKIRRQYGYTLRPSASFDFIPEENINRISVIESGAGGTKFIFNGERLETPLIGEFNVYNVGAAISTALALGVEMDKIKIAVREASAPPGRLELIDAGQDFRVIVDYAHEPASLEALYKTIINSGLKDKNAKMVCLLGGQGGGRDKWKRPAMGKIASVYCDWIILSNEDPYDESPLDILEDIRKGIENPKLEKTFLVFDRRTAIKKALSLAEKGDTVVLSGKGGESWMCVKNNKKILWDEKAIVEEELSKLPKKAQFG
jgi:UDP-N-acetylmuramoyl-L-alanyl-D-glutamate--2,6-diaminopimelate ligase